MELKVTRQGVSIEEALFDQTVEQSLDTDFTLPDYCPDISRILKCRVVPKIAGKTVSGNAVNLDGVLSVTVLYADNENAVRAYEHPVAFTKSLDMGVALTGTGFVTVQARPETINCRPVSERKVDVHGAVSLQIRVTHKCTAEVVADIDGGNIQMLRGTCPATSPMGGCEKYLIINDEMDLPDDFEPVRYNLRSDAMAVATECKIISNKAVIKGDMAVSVLYCGDETGSPQRFSSTLPVSQIVDIDGIAEGCNCAVDIDVVSLELKPRTGISGEARSFTLAAKLCMTVKATCDNDIAVIYDAYSTDYKEKFEKKDIVFEKLIAPLRQQLTCKKTLEFMPDELGTLIDVWCDTMVSGVTCDDRELTLTGTTLICVLARDMQDLPVYFERPVDFDYHYRLDTAPRQMRSATIVRATGATGTLTGNGMLEVKVELTLSVDVFDMVKQPVVTAFEIDQESMKEKLTAAALVIYYADEGERVWDIARHYNTRVDEVMSLNALTEETLSGSKMLMIPNV